MNVLESLLAACKEADESAVYALLDAGADVNQADPWGRTPLHEAVRHSYKSPEAGLRIVRRLLEAGANVDPRDETDGHTPLFEAAVYGMPDILQLLLAHGANPNAEDEDGETAVDAINGSPELRRTRKTILRILEEAQP